MFPELRQMGIIPFFPHIRLQSARNATTTPLLSHEPHGPGQQSTKRPISKMFTMTSGSFFYVFYLMYRPLIQPLQTLHREAEEIAPDPTSEVTKTAHRRNIEDPSSKKIHKRTNPHALTFPNFDPLRHLFTSSDGLISNLG